MFIIEKNKHEKIKIFVRKKILKKKKEKIVINKYLFEISHF